MKELDFKAHVWFLDGFSPSKNIDVWTKDIFCQMARLSYSNARVASFSVAALVRQGLLNSGFEIKKQKGFGRKREMLTNAKM